MNSGRSVDLSKIRVIDCLVGLLSIDSVVRTTAEQYLNLLEQDPAFGVRLSEEVILRQDISVQLRQLACIVLKNYIKVHWCAQSVKFEAPEVPAPAKAVIKAGISSALGCADPKLRTAVAMVVTGIMHWEWPAQWPGAFQELVQCLRSPDPNLLKGAVACLDMFVSSETLSESTVPGVVELLLPELLRIFMSSDPAYGPWVRDRVVAIFMSCVQLLSFNAGLNAKQVGAIFGTNLPSWIAAFAAVISRKDAPASPAHIGICTSVVRTLCIIMVSYPQYIAPYVPQLFSRIWSCFSQTYPYYQSIEVYGEKPPPSPPLPSQQQQSSPQPQQTEVSSIASSVTSSGSQTGTKNSGVDNGNNNNSSSNSNANDAGSVCCGSRDSTPSLPGLVAALMDFLTLVSERPRFRNTVQPLLGSMAQLTVGYLQVTTEQAESWCASPELIAADDEDDGFAVNVRLAGRTLLALLVRAFSSGGVGLRACWEATESTLTQASAMRRDGNPHWWRLREAGLTALCAIAPALASARRLRVDFPALAKAILAQDVSAAFTPPPPPPAGGGGGEGIGLAEALVAGRALCAAAELSARLPEAVSLPFVQAIASALGHPRSAALCICAARAVVGFYQSLPPVALAPFIGGVLRGLAQLVLGTTEDALTLFLYTLGASVRVSSDGVTAACEGEVVGALLETMARHPNDTILADDVAQTFAQLLTVQACYPGILEHLLPALSQILLNAETLQGLVLVALGILRTALITSTQSQQNQCQQKLQQQTASMQVKEAFSALGRFIANFACEAVDMDFMRAAVDVMRHYFLAYGAAILTWADDVSTFFFSVVARVLGPASVPDCKAMLVAPVLCDFLHYSARSPRPLGAAFTPLLANVLTRTLRTADSYAAAALITVFAHVALVDPTGILDFFRTRNNINDVIGDAMTDVMSKHEETPFAAVMAKWLGSGTLLRASGLYQVKVSVVALENILLLRDPLVEGSSVPDPAAPAVSRVTLPVAVLSYLCAAYKDVDWETAINDKMDSMPSSLSSNTNFVDDVSALGSIGAGAGAGELYNSSSSSNNNSNSYSSNGNSKKFAHGLMTSSNYVTSSSNSQFDCDDVTDDVRNQYTVDALTDFDEDALADPDDDDEDFCDDAPEELDLTFVAQRPLFKIDLKQQIEGFFAAAAHKGHTGFFKSIYDLLPPKDKAVFEVIWNRSKKL